MKVKPVLCGEFGGANYSPRDKFLRIVWLVVYVLFFKYSPTPFYGYRSLILRIFGASVGKGSRVYPGCKIWWPGNLSIGDFSAVANGVELYNQGEIFIGSRVVVSQGAYLCASTHDYSQKEHSLILKDIYIEDDVWVCAKAFIGPGAKIQVGGILGAGGVFFGIMDSWSVYGGNPAVKIKAREPIHEV